MEIQKNYLYDNDSSIRSSIIFATFIVQEI